MVDIHCHILPGVDDGAENFTQAPEMARMAASCGVTDLAATSHVRGDKLDPERLEEKPGRLLKGREMVSVR